MVANSNTSCVTSDFFSFFYFLCPVGGVYLWIRKQLCDSPSREITNRPWQNRSTFISKVLILDKNKYITFLPELSSFYTIRHERKLHKIAFTVALSEQTLQSNNSQTF